MPCNYTGLYDFEAYPDLAKFGLVDYDVRSQPSPSFIQCQS